MNVTALYNLEDDTVRLAFDGKPRAEILLKLHDKGLRFWPGRKLWVKKWSPGIEDLALELSENAELIIEELPDDVEGRSERFEGYADKRQVEATQKSMFSQDMMKAIPFGQPMMPGHHSYRRDVNYRTRAWNLMGKSVELQDRADYWRDRAAGVLRQAEHREKPEVIYGRIKALEADQRKFQRETKKYNRPEAVHYYTRWLKHVALRLEYETARFLAAGGEEVTARVTAIIKVGDRVECRWGIAEIISVGPKNVRVKLNSGTAPLPFLIPRHQIKQVT